MDDSLYGKENKFTGSAEKNDYAKYSICILKVELQFIRQQLITQWFTSCGLITIFALLSM